MQRNGPLLIGIDGSVGASLVVMEHDAKKMRGTLPFVFSQPEN